MDTRRIAVMIPCLDEELTVGTVVDSFRQALPGAPIYVYDNASTDRTAQVAREHGAVVVTESRPGKGNVARSMFRDIDADCYLMVDGDDTYPAEAAAALCVPILDGTADMVVGDRLSNGAYAAQNRRALHGFGNGLVCRMIHWTHGHRFRDVMSGYRAFSRAFVKTFPVLSEGFQLETELSIHAVDRRWRVLEIPIAYRDRRPGSRSKLSTVRDGIKVVAMIGSLVKNYRPLRFFCLIALILAVAGLALGVPVITEFLETGLVPRLPTALLATGLMFLAGLALATGMVLDTVAKADRRQWELTVYRELERERRWPSGGVGAGSGTQQMASAEGAKKNSGSR